MSLEKEIAQFHGYDEGLLFPSGYTANLGLMSSIASYDDCIVYDAEIHASTHDGIRLSQARASYPFFHNDMNHLEKRLQSCSSIYKRVFVAVESIYSVSGTKAPLKEIAYLTEKYGAYLIVDEAHAVGIYGNSGRGRAYEEGVVDHVFAQVTAFGKALGVSGAAVLGSDLLKRFLINTARSCIYTTAPSFISLIAIKGSYSTFPTMDEERKSLRKLKEIAREHLQWREGEHIIPIAFPGKLNARNGAQILRSEGFDVRPLTSPTVKKGKECIRIILHSFNSSQDLQRLLDRLKEIRGCGCEES